MDTINKSIERVVNNTQPKPLRHRLLWFVGIWAASVLALTLVSQVIRWAIIP